MTLQDELLYIQVEHMHFNPEDNSIVMNAHWTGLPNSLPSGYPVYIDFQAAAVQLVNNPRPFLTTTVTDQVENFFDRFTYNLTQEGSDYLLNAFLKP
jgi:hypothetical protein